MAKIELKARAKINLTLDVIGKRLDGFHEVEMIMQAIELHDIVHLEVQSAGITVTTNHPLLAAGESNIVYKAAKLVVDTYGIKQGIRIYIEKNIPVAAGLAGGSTDAAAVLCGLNSLWNLALDQEEIAQMGASIGSDVPFCVRGGTALAKGRGEVLASLPDVPQLWLVLAKPELEVSTAEVYRNFNPLKVGTRPKTAATITAIRNRDIDGIIGNLANVLESVTLTRYPEVSELKKIMEQTGLVRALMSGSGPTVFGIARDEPEAIVIADELKRLLPGRFVQVTRTWPALLQEFAGNS